MRTVFLEGYEIPADLAIRALYQFARVQGLGALHSQPGPLDPEEAKKMIEIWDKKNSDCFSFRRAGPYIDYLHGRVMKVDICDDLDLSLYVRDNGQAAARLALEYALDILTCPVK